MSSRELRLNGGRREKIRRRLIREAGGTPICALCGEPIDLKLRSPHPMSFEADHIDELFVSGDNSYENFQPAHRKCNLDKERERRRKASKRWREANTQREGLRHSLKI